LPLYVVAAGACLVFWIAYKTYGRFLGRVVGLNDRCSTPAHEKNDGVDFVPTPKGFLMGQHFSAIAAAGPIVGPILAGLWFGWLPVLLWIVFGSIFIGAMHDFASLSGSVKHGASTLVEMVHKYLGKQGYYFFLFFVWLSLIYVITAFTDITSGSFVNPELGGGVASSSVMYLLIGLAMGIALKVFRMPLGLATGVFLVLVVLAVAFGRYIPLTLTDQPWMGAQQQWNVLLLVYCFVASVIPVWLLLQPRGYLGGFFLYVTLALGIVGLFLGGEKIEYPAFLGFVNDKGMMLFPMLFVTVACGACSGFHGIVCSGTTSKQINRESDCQAVGYGGMLLEGLVAVVALGTVMILAKGSDLTHASPDRIYAEGLGRLVQHLGIPRDLARSFVLLAFTTFIYDTLDVATRLARYLLEELTGWKGRAGRMLATVLSLTIPLICVSIKITDASGNVVPAWKVFWTIFGTSNQLLAALTLMVLSVWLWRTKKPWWVSAIPMVFMLVMTGWSLLLMVGPFFTRLTATPRSLDSIGLLALVLLGLAGRLLYETVQAVRRGSAAPTHKT
jgi:carbon starvation protein